MEKNTPPRTKAEVSLHSLERPDFANFIGIDARIEHSIIIAPFVTIIDQNIILNKNNLPEGKITRKILDALSYSVRSSYAQLGIDITLKPINLLTDEDIQKINDGGNIRIPIWIHNLSPNHILLENNILRFYYLKQSSKLRGLKLKEAISKDLIINGIEGQDYIVGENRLLLRVKKNFAYKTKKGVVSIKDTGTDYGRSIVDTVLKPVDANYVPPFGEVTIGETVPVSLTNNVAMQINTGYDLDNEHKGIYGMHIIKSSLIAPRFGEKSATTIRTETIGNNEWVEFHVFSML